MRNKKGDIPITILVIGVLMICLFTILSFYLSDRAVKSSFRPVGVVDEIAIEYEKIGVYKSLGFNDQQIASILNIKQDEKGRFIQIEKDGLKIEYYIGQ